MMCIQVWIALLGVLTVALSIGVSFGIASAFGFSYGQLHATLPFLLLGKYIEIKHIMAYFIPQNVNKMAINFKVLQNKSLAVILTLKTKLLNFSLDNSNPFLISLEVPVCFCNNLRWL